MNNTVRVALATYEKLLADQKRLEAIKTEALGRESPTIRLAALISGDTAALLWPVTARGTSGDAAVDAERKRIKDACAEVERCKIVLDQLRLELDALPDGHFMASGLQHAFTLLGAALGGRHEQ